MSFAARWDHEHESHGMDESIHPLSLILGALGVLSPPLMSQVGSVASEQKISETAGGFGFGLDASDYFGGGVARIGDLNDDGVEDIAVGARNDDDGDFNQGAVWILFLNTDGTVAARQKISAMSGGFAGDLDLGDEFGASVAGLGDLNGDGVEDLAVGARLDDESAFDQGSVWILFLNSNGTVASHQKISATAGGFGGTLATSDLFGGALANLGDLDGNGVVDLAVGAPGTDGLAPDQGALWILFLDSDGTVLSERKVAEGLGGFLGDLAGGDSFGISLAAGTDLDGDGVADLVAGAYGDSTGGSGAGALWELFLNADGTVKSQQRIGPGAGGFEGLVVAGDGLGTALAFLGDLDQNGTVELAVGAYADDDAEAGAVWILFLEPGGLVFTERKLSAFSGGLVGPLDHGDQFGISAAGLGDLDGDGVADLVVGARLDDDGGVDQGAAWVLFLRADTTAPTLGCPGTLTRECAGPTGTVVSFAVSASDDHDPAPVLVCTPPSGTLFALGTTTVSCSVTDTAGNMASCSFDVHVVDTTPPSLTHPSEIAILDSKGGSPGAFVSFTVSASDLCDPSPSLSCTPPSGSFFPRGTTIVTCTAIDSHGNQASSQFPVVVLPTARRR